MLDPVIIDAIKASLNSNNKVTTVPSKNKNDYDTWIPIVSDINWDIILSNINTSQSAAAAPSLSSDIDSDIFEDRLLLSKPNVPGEASYFLIAPSLPLCGSCQLVGGDFSLRGGITYPSGDGPPGGEQGYPLVASNCEELNEYISMEPLIEGAEVIIGYPIDWTFQYADGELISGSGCENLPEDVITMYSTVAGLNQSDCISTDRFTLSWIQNTAILSTGIPDFDPYVYCQDGGYRLES